MNSNSDPTMTVSEAWAAYVRRATVAPVTMRGYECIVARHVVPALGNRTVADLHQDDVEALLLDMRAKGLSVAMVRHCRVLLSSICRTAVELGESPTLPTDGVKVARPAAPATRVMTPGEFLRVRDALPTDGARLLADVLVRSGMRLGEAFALAPGDVDDDVLLVRRCLSEPGRRFSPDGSRYQLRSTPKNGTTRRVTVGLDLTSRLVRWGARHELPRNGLVFPERLVLPPPTGRVFPTKIYLLPLTPERLAQLGSFTGPNGLTYQHGTMNGYVTGRCRDACCRQAISEYSAARKRDRRAAQGRTRRAAVLGAEGASRPGPAGELGAVSPKGWAGVWAAAVAEAGLDFTPLARHTRHAHASWLSASGVSVEQIAERLGHRDERSTRWYVRPVGSEPDSVAVIDALLGDTGAPVQKHL